MRRKLLLGPSFATALPPDAPYYLHLDSDDEDEDEEGNDVDEEDGGAAEDGGEVGKEAKGDGVVTADKLRWLYDEDDDALVDEVSRPRPHRTVYSTISCAWA